MWSGNEAELVTESNVIITLSPSLHTTLLLAMCRYSPRRDGSLEKVYCELLPWPSHVRLWLLKSSHGVDNLLMATVLDH